MSLTDFLLGKPIASDEDRTERIGAVAGIPIFGLDALGSAAYGPEAALTLLIPLGLAGVHYIIPISGSIIVLLAIVYFSYRQTIEAYPTGGGSYTVASENLGTFMGLLAAAALMIDYVLVVAVGISAGVGALVSALPAWQPYTLYICLAALAVITIVNMRGLRDTGAVFSIPTYLFVACLFIALILGLWKTVLSGGHPVAVFNTTNLGPAQEAVSLWLLLKAFSSGCTAMTGVEAVSNGVMAFREPRRQSARLTLTIIIVILMLLLTGIAYLCNAYGIGAAVPGQAGYQSVLSQLVSAITGRGWFYYVTMVSILLVLALQANTAFADFPRLCRAVAQNGYLPHAFAARGRRLVYSYGIYVLVFLSGSLLVIFGGVTDRLIPLFAIGAFLAFTLSQAGMVVHWKRRKGLHFRRNILINGLGAIATAITVIVVIGSKFSEGAWITLLLIPGLIMLMMGVRRHYSQVARAMAGSKILSTVNLRSPLVVVPIEEWNRISQKAVRFALTLSHEVVALHIDSEEEDVNLAAKWADYVDVPVRDAGLPVPELVVLKSPYRYAITPTLDYVLELERIHSHRQIAVVVPTLVARHWYQRFLHNQRGEILTALLLLKGTQRIVIVNVPWYLSD
jgi:amino acid transporter